MATKKTAKKKATNKTKKTTSRARKADNRTGQRVPIQLLVDYKADGHYLFDFCRDLGTGGVFIETQAPLDQGSPIDLTFTIPDSKETLNASGQVIWVQRPVEDHDVTPGMGVQFTQFTCEQRELLENFVKRYHGNRFLDDGGKKAG